MSAIFLQGITPETLADLISATVKSQLDEFKKELNTKEPEQLLTREQTAELLQVNLSTLWHWENKGKIQGYIIGNRRYYKRNEILESLNINNQSI